MPTALRGHVRCTPCPRKAVGMAPENALCQSISNPAATGFVGMNRLTSHHAALASGLRLHYAQAGQGEPVVLLHGFPEFWYSWRHQLSALADAGFGALAVDLPGYNESDRPAAVCRYRVKRLVGDVAAFIRQVAGGSAFVVGHDWGGLLAFRLAALHPKLVRKLAVLNAPHPAAYRAELRRHPRQWFRSAYVLFFQLPRLPEMLLAAGDFAILERAWRGQPVHPGAFTEQDIVEYKRSFRRPGGLTGPLNYYRAAVRYPRDLHAPPQTIAAPTLVVWGEQDPYLGVRLLDHLADWVPNLRLERIADASHWVQNDVPGRVNQLLLHFFAERPQL
jgi:epoxide hydrolase 4